LYLEVSGFNQAILIANCDIIFENAILVKPHSIFADSIFLVVVIPNILAKLKALTSSLVYHA
jgi:hypothetical protein